MSINSPLEISRTLLATFSTKMFRYYEERIPKNASILVVSNHRSFMDAPILMTGLERPIRFACHHYMGQVPLLREIVTLQMGCFPLEAKDNRQKSFLRQASGLLQTGQAVGVFPEGTKPMVEFTSPSGVSEFQRGFAHLALRAQVKDLAILPVAIASLEEVNTSTTVPLKFLSFFDPTEPLFNQPGWHPLVVYRRVAVLIGHPYWITANHRQQYQGKQARSVVTEVTEHCYSEIDALLKS
jgi:1-acyl-sn-glycerol-3-phosphate acyltransferase